ncbi:MAG TPA: 1,2-phenylacetyl-CoA epoxidase subunit PaaD [Ignavibacteria bacterium]
MINFKYNIKESIKRSDILKALSEIMDPEIPTISIVDLGIVNDVKINDDYSVSINLTPTFSGCPALKYIEDLVRDKIGMLGIRTVSVKTSFDVQWNTDMITEKGLEALKKHGLAPPEKHNGLIQIEILEKVKCPHCGSINTTLKTPFGPTLCRSIHYCNDCLNAFEQFKPVS